MYKKNSPRAEKLKKRLSGERTAIVVLGGALKETKAGWRTTNFNEGDNFGVTGDRLRVLAAAALYHYLSGKNKNISVIASGGKGQYRGTNTPVLSKILKSELAELGVAKNKILEEDLSNSTRQQLIKSAEILKKENIRNAIIISNKYHLPRIKAFIEADADLKKFYRISGLRAAEDILMDFNPGNWAGLIKKVYASKAMEKRIELERAGVKQIKSGTYGKIKTAIIGLGNITWGYEKNPAVMKRMDFPTHFSVLRKHPSFQLVAAQDKNVEARKKFARHAKKFRITPAMYSNWEEMIKKEQPDLLVVASNTESHIEICSRAIKLGVKNILCEKPISYSLKDAEKLVRSADKHKCNLYINYLRAFSPSHKELIKNIRAGSFGRIRRVEIRYSKGILNNGTHMIDLLVRMFGAPKLITAVKSTGHPPHRFGKNDWNIDGSLIFSNGISGSVRYLEDEASVLELEITGDRRSIKIVNDRVVFGKGSISIRQGLYPVYENIHSGISSGDASRNNCSGKDSLGALSVAIKIIKNTNK